MDVFEPPDSQWATDDLLNTLKRSIVFSFTGLDRSKWTCSCPKFVEAQKSLQKHSEIDVISSISRIKLADLTKLPLL